MTTIIHKQALKPSTANLHHKATIYLHPQTSVSHDDEGNTTTTTQKYRQHHLV